MRLITPYEREKWFDKYDRFELGEACFLSYGDELGEAFLACLNIDNYADYLIEYVVLAAQTAALDMYYDQLMYFTGDYGGYETIESLGLPSLEQLQEKAKELRVDTISYFGSPERTDKERRLWDWAFEWREEHWQETLDRLELERLEQATEEARRRING